MFSHSILNNKEISKTIKKQTGLKQVKVSDLNIKVNIKTKQFYNIKKSSKATGHGIILDCTINKGNYKCLNPETENSISLIDGKVFKISSSEEIDEKNTTINYYIIAPLVFLSDILIELSLKELDVDNLEEFFDYVEYRFNEENKIKDKCLKVPLKIREESKAPYNTTCIFFDGLNKINVLGDVLLDAFIPSIKKRVINEYFDLLLFKIEQESALSIIEYCMYLAILKQKKGFKYVGTCSSDDTSIIC
jgi:hypothetical protein